MLKLLRKIGNFSINFKASIKFFNWVFLFLIISVFFIFFGKTNINVKAQGVQSSDAIAVRVLLNPDNYSALRWYRERGFSGSPQSLIVDGYEAIRDNRTVYVNAANVSGSTFFTNIYLISYNQDAEKATQDIFSEILSHWKFNINLTVPGTCVPVSGASCLIDSECPLGEYCSSNKAAVTRDTRRLADLADIRTELKAYRAGHGFFPKLEAGSYLKNKTISTWPSWRDRFSDELGFNLPIDPINKLGDCGNSRFNTVTCWDEIAKEFSGGNPAGINVNLPANSQAYAYAASADGSNYQVCAVMQSGYISGIGNGACSSGVINNSPPQIINSNFPDGCQGKEYEAFVEAHDPDGDDLSWSLNGNWGAAIYDIPGSPNKKRIYAASAGSPGTYNFQVGINDNRGGSANGNYSIEVSDCVPPCIPSCSSPISGCQSSAPAHTSVVPGSNCCGSGSCYDCASGYNWNGSSCQPICSVSCSSPFGGCQSSAPANTSVVLGSNCCGSGSCYECAFGFNYSGGGCQPVCSLNCSSPFGSCQSSAPAHTSVVPGSECCGSGSCYQCASGYHISGGVCVADCSVSCSSPFGGCQSSAPAHTSVVPGSECCGSGSCYQCASGYHISGGVCVADCSVSCSSPFGGCQSSAPAHTSVVPGSECCGSGSCYQCASGYHISGGVCVADCSVSCSSPFGGCQSSAPAHTSVVPGSECCGSGSCYQCASGYHISGGVCVADCSVSCSSPFGGCQSSAPAHTSVVPGSECCGSGSCYQCASGYHISGGVCVADCVVNCSTGPGCRSSLSNGQVVAGNCCGSGSCYDCASGYTWNPSSGKCESDCSVYFQGAFIGSPQDTTHYPPFTVTPISEELDAGQYPVNSNILVKSSQLASLDGIAIDDHARLELWSGPNYTGTKILDVFGPVVINNSYWLDLGGYDYFDPPYTLANSFGLNTSVWPDCRFSTGNMHNWGYNGSMIISCF